MFDELMRYCIERIDITLINQMNLRMAIEKSVDGRINRFIRLAFDGASVVFACAGIAVVTICCV